MIIPFCALGLMTLNFLIKTTWDNSLLKHNAVEFVFQKQDREFVIDIKAPFFGDPPAPEQMIGTFFNLWDYEVAEVFFLSDSGKYLELEFGPYGHYLVIMFDGPHNLVNKGVRIDYEAKILKDQGIWLGKAVIPEAYFPAKVSKFNAYAIHGSNENRVYEALYPAPKGQYANPDFHRLELFKFIDFKSFFPINWQRDKESIFWTPELQ